MHLTLTLNGKPVSADIDAATLLVDFIRTHQALTGTHVGCDTAQCGACTVLVDGKATKSCNVLALQVAGSSITTIEGLAAEDGTLHPMQSAFKQHHGLQCGFCTPGMVLSAVELKGKNLSEEQIRAALDGNMCRCTGYQNIVKAVKTGLANMA